jgi:hypothetical protein
MIILHNYHLGYVMKALKSVHLEKLVLPLGPLNLNRKGDA